MDPFSAILLIGLFTVATVKTAGTAATDGLAQARGQTPPSQERWRAKEEKKRSRGEQPREDPGGLRRIWQQHTEAAAEKSAAKHDGTMRYLREHGDDIAEGKKRQLERSARRREYLGSKVAAAGGSSWQALKAAAQKAADAKRGHDDRKAEKDAWRENERRDEEEAHDRNDSRAGDGNPDGEQQDATVLDFTHRSRPDGSTEVEVTDDDAGTSTITGDPADPSTWRGTDEYGRDIQTGRGPSVEDRHGGVVHDSGEYQLRDESPARRIVQDHQHAESAAQAGTGSETTLPDPQTSPLTADGATNGITESFGGLTVTTHSGEITDLTSAIAYVTTASQYCDQISGTFETTQAQANATAQEMEGQLGGLETAQSSLRSFELDSEANRLAQVHERYSELVQAMQHVETALTTAQEAITAAKSELDDSASEFQSQMGISEQVNAHDSIANDTTFYTYQ